MTTFYKTPQLFEQSYETTWKQQHWNQQATSCPSLKSLMQVQEPTLVFATNPKPYCT